MRKITQQTVNAFLSNQNFSLNNTQVLEGELFLHGNKIARKVGQGKIEICFCGWVTNTTSNRLNALVRAFTNDAISIATKQGKPLLVCHKDGKKIVFDSNQWLLINC